MVTAYGFKRTNILPSSNDLKALMVVDPLGFPCKTDAY